MAHFKTSVWNLKSVVIGRKQCIILAASDIASYWKLLLKKREIRDYRVEQCFPNVSPRTSAGLRAIGRRCMESWRTVGHWNHEKKHRH